MTTENQTLRVAAQLTILPKTISLVAEEDCFPFKKGQVVKRVRRETLSKMEHPLRVRVMGGYTPRFKDKSKMIIDAKHLYKEETGLTPESVDYEIYRSKGRWVVDVTDEEILSRIGRESYIEIPDIDYVEWLENKVMDLINKR